MKNNESLIVPPILPWILGWIIKIKVYTPTLNRRYSIINSDEIPCFKLEEMMVIIVDEFYNKDREYFFVFQSLDNHKIYKFGLYAWKFEHYDFINRVENGKTIIFYALTCDDMMDFLETQNNKCI